MTLPPTPVIMSTEVAGWLANLDDGFVAAVHAMVGTYVHKQQVDLMLNYSLH